MSNTVLSFDLLGKKPNEEEETQGITSEEGRGILDSLPYSEYSDEQFSSAYSEEAPSMGPAPVDPSDYPPTNEVGNLNAPDVGVASEKLASGPDRFQVPTDESLDAALDSAFSNIAPRIQGNPTFGALEWEDPSYATGKGGTPVSSTPKSVASFSIAAASKEEDYGWGIKNAWKRGLIRAGQLIDLAQGDEEEYAEGQKELANYSVSEHDAKRLEKLQESDGFWEAVGEYITNPALAMQVVVESLPMSTAPLVGGLVGGVVGNVPGAMVGAFAGSFGTEYLASMSDALQEHGVDATDPKALKAAFADDEFMATARAFAAKRGVGVATFDALSMGLAGRIYKPVKALTGAAQKGANVARRVAGGTLGGTSELLAQGFAGAGGEVAGQVLSGQEYDPAAAAGELVGEFVPGLGEIAISKLTGKDAGGNKPEDTTPPPKKPKVKRNPDGSWSEVEPEGGIPADIDTSIPDTGDVDVDAEGADRQVETPPLESETATTSPTPTDETAPTKAQEETSSEVVEEVEVDDMLAAAADKEEAAEEAAKEAEPAPEEVTPLIDTKTLGPKVTKTINDNKTPGPVRKAWGGLMQALTKRYPDTKAKVPASRFTGTGVAKFFKQLQDDVDITTDLPEIKAFLDVVTTGKPAEVIQALERLTSQVQSSSPTLADAPIDSIAGQVQAVYNDFMQYYESHQRVSKAKKTKGQTVLKGNKIPMANKLGEMAAAIRGLMKAAEEAGVLNWRAIEKGLITDPGLDANWAKAVDIAEEAAQAAQAPIEKKSGSGGKTKTIIHGEATLLKAANNLKDIAEKITPLLAAAEVEGKQYKADVKAANIEDGVDSQGLVEETSAVTEEPAKPKKPTKAGKVGVEHKEQSTADWVRGYTRPGNKMGVTAGTTAAIEKNLQILEKSGHPEAALLRKQVEKTEYKELKSPSEKMAAGTEVVYKPSKWKMTVTPKDTKSVKQMDKTPIVGGFNTKQEAMAHARAVKKELGGATIEVVKDPDFVAPEPKVQAKAKAVAKKKAAAKKAAAKKATKKKPDVKGAPPAEVFDREQNIVGAEAAELKASVDAETIDEAFGKAGVSKSAAKRIRGLMGVLDKAGKRALTNAADEYVATGDMVRFTTQIDKIVGKVPSPALMEAYTEFSIAIREKEADRLANSEEAQRQDAMDNLVDDHLDMTEDERAIAEMTGAIEPTFDPDESTVDEHNVPYSERLRTFVDSVFNKLVPKRDRNRIRIDQAIVERALNKIRAQLDAVTRSSLIEDQFAKPDKINMAEMIDLLLSVLPTNHRYTHLLKLLKSRNLRGVDIQLSDSRFSLDSYGEVAGLFTLGVDKNGVTDPNSSKIELLYEKEKNADDFVRRMLHEMLHAATALRYYTDKLFANHVDALWLQAVEAYAKTDPTFSLEKFNEARETGGSNGVTAFMLGHMKTLNDNGYATSAYYGLVNSHEFMSEAFTQPEFQVFLANTQLQSLPGMLAPSRRRVSKFGSTVSILSDFIKSIGSFLGVSTRNTVLEEIILSTTANFDSNISYGFGKGRVKFAKKRPIQDKITADNPYDGKYDSASLTKLVSQALKVKTRAKELLKAARAAQANIKKGAPPLEVDAVVTKTGKAINRAKKAIELLSIGLEAADSGRRHVIQDHLERAEEHLSKVKTIKINVKEYDRGTGKVRVTARHEFFSPEYAKDKYLELRAAGLSMSFRGVDAETIRSWGPVEAPNTFAIIDEESIPDKKVRSTVVNDTADAARNREKVLQQTRETLVEKLKGLPRAINLGFMNRDVIERNYRELFARAGKAAGHALSPLTMYIKMKQMASNIAEEFALRATAALTKLQKLDNKTRSKVFAMMRDTTLAQVWPHLALTDKRNAHLWTKPDKKGVSKLSPELGKAATKARKEWVALHRKDPKAAELLIEMAELTREIQDRKRIEALRTVGKVYSLDAAIIKQLGELESREDIMKMFPGMYDKDGSLIDTNDTAERPADTVAVKGDSKEVKKQKNERRKEWVKRRTIAKTAEEIVKGTSINGPYFPLRRYGKYVVSSTEDYNENNEPYVSFHHTRKEAKRVAAGLEKKHKIPTYITKKIESMAIPRDVESVTSELAKRMGSRKDGVSDYMGQRLQAAMIEIMSDNTAYASQLKRHGVDGVASDDMGRAFEEYVFVTKYTLGDIATAHEVHQALKDLKSLQSKGAQDVLRQDAATEDEVILIGDVVNELAAQNREDAKDREMSSFQKGVGLIGFFNFLGAPSYWILNATQTLTVTLPYIGSKWGAKGTGAYTSAAATVLKAAKGAKSYDQFKANLPAAAQKVVAELERQGILQSTIAHQFGDIMTPSTLTTIQNWAGPVGKATATALKLMETIPEGVEKYNRISTALAIYNLSDGNMTAVADGVQATQFNYDSANRARLMKAAPGWAGGGLRAVITPMMMFKSYGIGLTRLLYGGMAKAAVGKTAAERSEARKLAGGLIVSHSVFGGVAGGMMIAPVQAIVWAFNQAFREAGDEFDPEEAVQLYLQDVANDTVAALVSRGLPAAFGGDLSKSINLGNLIWMGNDRINLNDAGGVETAMTTALGPVAQWGVTSVREGSRLFSGDPRGNWYDFAAAAIPLKMARGTIRGLKYEVEGVGTDTLTFIDPDDVTGWIRSAMGFRPTNIAMVTDFEYSEMGRENRRSTRKSTLINKALRADTPSKRAAAWDDIQSFNRSLEKRGDWINRGDVVRLRSRRRSRQRDYDRKRR